MHKVSNVVDSWLSFILGVGERGLVSGFGIWVHGGSKQLIIDSRAILVPSSYAQVFNVLQYN